MITETYTTVSDEVSVRVTASAPESLRSKRIKRTGVRVYDGGRIGVSGYLGEGGHEAALGRAREALSYGIPYPCEPSGALSRREEAAAAPLGAAGLDAEAGAVMEALRRDFPEFILSSSGLKAGSYTCSLRNDAGLDLSSTITRYEMLLSYKQASSSSILDGWLGYAGPGYDRAAFVAYVSELLEAYRREVPLPAEGRLPVFFMDSEPEPDVIRIFQTELGGIKLASGGSLFSGKTGQRVFSDKFSLYNSRAAAQLPFFDAEGVCGEGFKYVENGVLLAPFADKRTAARYGLASSGTASCAYDGAPSPVPGEMRIKPGTSSFREMTGGGDAVFVSVASGGDFTSEGGFGTPAQVAFLMRDGKPVGRLPQLQLNSSVYEMYGKDFLGVSADKVMPLSDARWLGFMMDVRRM